MDSITNDGSTFTVTLRELNEIVPHAECDSCDPVMLVTLDSGTGQFTVHPAHDGTCIHRKWLY